MTGANWRQVWYRVYPGADWIPSEATNSHARAVSLAEDLQRAYPFGDVEIRPLVLR